MPKYYIGTAGWSYKDWVVSFYPKNQSVKFDWLRYYSEFFNCVEVNSTFYTYLSPKIAEGWINKTESKDDFQFTIKLHQDFTHKSKFGPENIAAVKSVLHELNEAGRLGAMLIQFPFSFAYNNVAVEFISRLAEIFDVYNKVIEVRHSSWLNNEVTEIFENMNLTFCSIDQPQIGKSISFEPVITSDRMYIRFHWRNKEGWSKSINNFNKTQSPEEANERYRYLYSPGELVEIQQVINILRSKVKEIYIILNNHPGGNAIANAFELIHFLEEKAKVKIPETTLLSYPRLRAISAN